MNEFLFESLSHILNPSIEKLMKEIKHENSVKHEFHIQNNSIIKKFSKFSKSQDQVYGASLKIRDFLAECSSTGVGFSTEILMIEIRSVNIEKFEFGYRNKSVFLAVSGNFGLSGL